VVDVGNDGKVTNVVQLAHEIDPLQYSNGPEFYLKGGLKANGFRWLADEGR